MKFVVTTSKVNKESLMHKSLWRRWTLNASLIVLTAGLFACGGDEEEGAQVSGGQQVARGGQGQAGGRPGGQAGRQAGGRPSGGMARMMGAMSGRGGAGAAIPVAAKSVDRGDIAVSLQTYTTIEAERHVDVIARAQGLVTELYVEEGDRVEEGQPLAQLDQDALKLQVRERDVNMQSMKSNYERAADLLAKELLSTQEFEQTKFQYETAKTQLETAQLNLEYSTIRSPFSGVVTDRLIEVGNLVNANTAVFRAADFDPLLARIFIPERQIQQVKKGQSVRIGTEGSTDTFTGRVRMISPIVDPASCTVKVTVEIRDRTRTMRPGMFATVNIITEIHENVIRIEKRALVAEAEGSFAFLFNDGNAKKVRIELGEDEGDWIEVTSGLAEGDSIITVGHEGLRNGAPVRIAGQQVASAAPAGGPAMGGGQGRPDGQAMRGGDQGGQGRPGGGMMGGMDIEQMKERIFGRNPELKKAYDKKAAEDADFAKDEEKQRAFIMEQVRKMRGGSGGARRPQ